jgi:hypothetical protein
MSMDTLHDIGSSSVVLSSSSLEDLEYVLEFQSFPYKKTGANIAKWLVQSHEEAGLLPGYVMHHATDGASNAKLSAKEFDLLTRDQRATTMTFSTCSAHQVHRAALYASGDPSFKTILNPELHKALSKLHGIFERIRRSVARTKILDEIQINENR